MGYKEKFIIRANKIHNNKYNYDKIIYSSQKDKIIVTCPLHGDFKINAKHHLNGGECPQCRKNRLNYTTENFIINARKIYGDKFDYSKAIYTTYTGLLTIICPIHGEFEQSCNVHLNSVHGCPKCAAEQFSIIKRNSNSNFIKISEIIHNYKYDYKLSNYSKNNIPVTIICPEHGEFKQQPSNHMKGAGCSKCKSKEFSINRKWTKEKFLKECEKIHGNLYNYDKVVYNGKNEKVKIICKEHGEFEQLPYVHLRGSKCPKCNYICNTFKREEWVLKGAGKEGIFYIIRCFNENENFYKLGITYKSLKFRYRKSMMPYNWETILEIKSFDLERIWNLESINKKLILNKRYNPKIHFEGCVYECFTDLTILKLK
jgi:Zn finger protein HypA/HybF involved in hydrogenase expression